MAIAEEKAWCVTWEIERYGLLLTVPAAEDDFVPVLASPFWKLELTEGSAWWSLHAWQSDSRIWFGLVKLKGPSTLPDGCEMFLKSSCGEVPLKREATSLKYSIERDVLLGDKRQSILPNDTLSLFCRIRMITILNPEFRIISVLHRVNYLWKTETFDSFRSYNAHVEKLDFFLFVSLKQNSEKGNHTITVDLSCVEKCFNFVDYSLSIKDGRGRIINETCPFPYVKWICNFEIFSVSNTKLNINLQIETIVARHKVSQDQLDFRSPQQIVTTTNDSEAVSESTGALVDDLLLLYRESALTDATLNTEGKSFSAHRSILSARSPVFRAMFEKDEMSEGRSGVVDIDDLDSETIDRMLVFMYGDSLKSMQWEEASTLYYAADKYAVLLLKQKCADILKAGVTADNACDALVLADKHSDQDLMQCVVDFIFGHKEVISSARWEELEDSKPRLCAKITRQLFLEKSKK